VWKKCKLGNYVNRPSDYESWGPTYNGFVGKSAEKLGNLYGKSEKCGLGGF
jgi:hypothetical protein